MVNTLKTLQYSDCNIAAIDYKNCMPLNSGMNCSIVNAMNCNMWNKVNRLVQQFSMQNEIKK